MDWRGHCGSGTHATPISLSSLPPRNKEVDAIQFVSFSSFILNRPADFRAERLGGVQWPIWIAQQRAGQQHCICFSRSNNVIGLLGVGDKPDRAAGDADLPANRLRE